MTRQKNSNNRVLWSTDNIRARFLSYFERQGHTFVASSSLIPENDSSLLFTNAGMVQFKDIFLGKQTLPYKRAMSSQKCVRAGGKHNDLENVGFTARHHTFFEMLGNFSFGDYFKQEAIHFAWEFITKELALPKEKLHVTVFNEDEQAAKIWHEQEGLSWDRIIRMGMKDNFWSMGETGPCGPCTEIFVDRGIQFACERPGCKIGCDCDRYLEIWNLVFMQYNRTAQGALIPLPRPSVDTGAGLERLASVLQGVETNYDTDCFSEIIEKIRQKCLHSDLYKKLPQKDQLVSLRVLADHVRSSSFLIADGVVASNEGRGYVLRRILRRAIRHAKRLGFEKPVLFEIATFVVEQMGGQYPELFKRRDLIAQLIHAEEEQFFRTLERGLNLLEEELKKLKQLRGGQNFQKCMPGEIAFKLYDTYGFPLDLTQAIAAESQIEVDVPGFEKAMQLQKMTSRLSWKGGGPKEDGDEDAEAILYRSLAEKLSEESLSCQFVGYEHLTCEGRLLALLVPTTQNTEQAPKKVILAHSVSSFEISEPALIVQAIFDQTPFYPEGGGQVSDQGRVVSSQVENFQPNVVTDLVADVVSVKSVKILSSSESSSLSTLIVVHLRLLQGRLQVGQSYLQLTDVLSRSLIARNHTATHLLNWALRKVLGDHVKQAGSLVNSELLRFDFNHFQALSNSELRAIENLINLKIAENLPILKVEVSKQEALTKMGALAHFDEKYGEIVRVVQLGDFSVELCGGTHSATLAELQFVKLVQESGIAAGVRRIVALSSQAALHFVQKQEDNLSQLRHLVGVSANTELPLKVEKLLAQEHALKKQVELLEDQSVEREVRDLLKGPLQFYQGQAVLLAIVPTQQNAVKHLRLMTDKVMADKITVGLGVALSVLGMVVQEEKKVFLVLAVNRKLLPAVQANLLLQKLLPFIDGKGGGRPDQAQATGTKPQGLVPLMDQVVSLLGS